MKNLVDQLAQYAAYHRDPRNIATHFVGIPLIVQAVAVLLAQPQWVVAGLTVSPIWLVAALAALFYLRLSLGLGAVMAVWMAGAVWIAHAVAAQGASAVWTWGVGLFVLGWVIQFVGHWYEGRKPAFVDDLVGLLVGPLFVLCEALMAAGMLRDVQAQVEARVGPVRRNPHAPVAS